MFGLKNEINKFLNDFLGVEKYSKSLNETDTSYIINSEFPGMEKDKIKVFYQNDYTIIKVNNQELEIFTPNANYEKAEANYHQGLLTIILPKNEIPNINYEIKIV